MTLYPGHHPQYIDCRHPAVALRAIVTTNLDTLPIATVSTNANNSMKHQAGAFRTEGYDLADTKVASSQGLNRDNVVVPDERVHAEATRNESARRTGCEHGCEELAERRAGKADDALFVRPESLSGARTMLSQGITQGEALLGS